MSALCVSARRSASVSSVVSLLASALVLTASSANVLAILRRVILANGSGFLEAVMWLLWNPACTVW